MNNNINTRPGSKILKPLSFQLFSVLFFIAISIKFVQLSGRKSQGVDTFGMVSYYLTALLGAMTIYYRVAPDTMTTSLTVVAMFGVLFFFQDLVELLVRKPKEKELETAVVKAEAKAEALGPSA